MFNLYISKIIILIITIKVSLFSTLFSQDDNKIKLNKSDILTNYGNSNQKFKLLNNVNFSHKDIVMTCDSAYADLLNQRAFAFGKVMLNKRDSIIIYGDSLTYNAKTNTAIMYGNVILNHNLISIITNRLIYNVKNNTVSYDNYATITSTKNYNTLYSKSGVYHMDSRKMTFDNNVKLRNNNIHITTDKLNYNENSEIAHFFSNTTIVDKNGVVRCNYGYYDTKNDVANFQKNAIIESEENILKADNIYYDQRYNYASATKNIEIIDTLNKIKILSELAFQDKNKSMYQLRDSILGIYALENDTLFFTSDTIKIYENDSSNNKKLYAYNYVKIYKSDFQAICDSLFYNQEDSILILYKNPVFWNDSNQFFGDTIIVYMNKNGIDKIEIVENAMIIQKYIDTIINKIEIKYNQIKGRTIIANFDNDSLKEIFAYKNAETIYYNREKDKKGLYNMLKSENLKINISNNKINKISFIKGADGKITPSHQVNEDEIYLNNFEWKDKLRPKSVKDISLRVKY